MSSTPIGFCPEKRNDNGKDAEHLHKGNNVIGLGTSSRKQRPLGAHMSQAYRGPIGMPKGKERRRRPPLCRLRGEELTEYRKFYGRVIVRYHKSAQQPIQHAEELLDEIIVEKVLSPTESL